jgi:hypothetical protein
LLIRLSFTLRFISPLFVNVLFNFILSTTTLGFLDFNCLSVCPMFISGGYDYKMPAIIYFFACVKLLVMAQSEVAYNNSF